MELRREAGIKEIQFLGETLEIKEKLGTYNLYGCIVAALEESFVVGEYSELIFDSAFETLLVLELTNISDFVDIQNEKIIDLFDIFDLSGVFDTVRKEIKPTIYLEMHEYATKAFKEAQENSKSAAQSLKLLTLMLEELYKTAKEE